MITERTLRNWRRDSLKHLRDIHTVESGATVTGELLNTYILADKELNDRIIRLTSDLLDVHLMKGK